jgi:hypothetical protein
MRADRAGASARESLRLGWLEKAAGFFAAVQDFPLWRLLRFWAVLLLPVSLLLVNLAAAYPAVTERVYSTGMYPVLAGVFGRLSSLVSFSLAEWMVFLGPLALIGYIIVALRGIIRDKSARSHRVSGLAATLCCVLGTGYFLFTVTCGFNYHRLSFAETSGLEVRPSSAEELAALCEGLVSDVNQLRASLAEDSSGVMAASFASSRDMAAFAQGAYQPLSASYPQLGGYTARPKPVLLSRGMSYLDITGVYTFYSTEANVNADIPDYGIPSTMLHELAHFKGYMREDEANFLAYLSCRESGSGDFAYSGTMLAMIHSTNALYSADRDRYDAVMGQLSDGVWRDLAANSAYWKQFEGPVAEVSAKVNDAYLRSNKQEAGVKSYGAMVDLLLADWRKEND